MRFKLFFYSLLLRLSGYIFFSSLSISLRFSLFFPSLSSFLYFSLFFPLSIFVLSLSPSPFPSPFLYFLCFSLFFTLSPLSLSLSLFLYSSLSFSSHISRKFTRRYASLDLTREKSPLMSLDLKLERKRIIKRRISSRRL